MFAEIVSIGNEVLSGMAVNTNAALISQKLSQIGFQMKRHTAIADDHDIIIETLAESLACSPLVITTGGLGPTVDDITRKAVAELCECSLEYNAALGAELKKRFGDIASLEDQATIPSKALILPNRAGTASGLVLQKGNALLVLLPGVPLEVETVLEEELIPFLQKTFKLNGAADSRLLHFFDLFESTVDPVLRKAEERFPHLKIGIYPAYSLLTVKLSGSPREVEIVASEILKEFGDNQYESADGLIESAIQEIFIRKNWTLTVAESCTGGALSALLTKQPGASKYFLGGAVSYSNALKEKWLDVPSQLIQEKGAVSKEVSKAMVEGLLKETGADFSIAITGVAGPDGGTPEKPAGTVFIAICQKGKGAQVFPLHAKGNRKMVIQRSIFFALAMLYKHINRE